MISLSNFDRWPDDKICCGQNWNREKKKKKKKKKNNIRTFDEKYFIDAVECN